MGGTLEYCCGLQAAGGGKKKNMKQQQLLLQTVEVKVRLDCDGCELKIKKALSCLNGVQSVEVNRRQQKVTVIGYVEPNKVMRKIASTGNKAVMWPYVPYNLVARPYTPQAYDLLAPPGFVRDVGGAAGGRSDGNDAFVAMFSDDNPNSCSIM